MDTARVNLSELSADELGRELAYLELPGFRLRQLEKGI